ncbi:hypothetical protein [Streptococcus danieliae]|uniref:hypothetical protein n=1 Tax=Streptococcus danieliae TaxID=747656 RepID=UPI0026EEC208|nr:hypothetical protein [Streptococcus danieliae]
MSQDLILEFRTSLNKAIDFLQFEVKEIASFENNGFVKLYELDSSLRKIIGLRTRIEEFKNFSGNPLKDNRIVLVLEQNFEVIMDLLSTSYQDNKFWRLDELLEKTIKSLDAYENSIDFNYIFSEEEKSEIQKEIVDFLDAQYYKKIEVDVPASIKGTLAIYFEEEVFLDYRDDFSSYFEDLIEDNVLSKEEILDWIYENNKDYEWYADYFETGKFKASMLSSFSNMFLNMNQMDLQNFVENVEISISYDMSSVADRIYMDLEVYVQDIDSNLTLEHVQSSKHLRDVLGNGLEEYIYCYKEFANPEILDGVSFSDIAKGIIEKRSSKAGQQIISHVRSQMSSVELEDEYDEFDMIYSYISEDGFQEVAEMIVEDSELVYAIIPEDNYFNVNGLWILVAYYY